MIRAIFISTILALSGCAVFDGGKVPKTTLASVTGDSLKPTLAYSSKAMGGIGQANALPEAAQSIIEGELTAVLEDSGYFRRIAKKDETADIRIDVTMTNSGNPAAMIPAFITGFSLYTIPSWATDHFYMTATVARNDGFSKEYKLHDTTTLVQWLPMIFVFPARNFSIVPEVRKNMYRKLLADMREDGFFAATAAELSLSNQGL